jgi:uncharacterized protein (TIGR02594 family)
MRLTKKRATLLLCSLAVAALASSAIARPVHHHHAAAAAGPAMATGDQLHTFQQQAAQERGERRGRRAQHSPASGTRNLAQARAAAQSHANSAYGGFTNNSLVAEARKYIGTNPTGRRSLWCGAFMDMVLKRTGHKGGGNLAFGYSHYGRRISGPQIGAIAVMGRHGGGHVGVVSGIDANGNPIIVSGNHNHTVAESVYPRSRISAYVLPGS